MNINVWGSDGKISLPEPPTTQVLVDFGGSGFGFTAGGICHIVSSADIEEIYYPPYSAPPS